jgi:hypothetical protein
MILANSLWATLTVDQIITVFQPCCIGKQVVAKQQQFLVSKCQRITYTRLIITVDNIREVGSDLLSKRNIPSVSL